MKKLSLRSARSGTLLLAVGALLCGGMLVQGCSGGNSGLNLGNPNPTPGPTGTPTATPTASPTPTGTPVPGSGAVRGRVLAPNGTTPISGATISTNTAQAVASRVVPKAILSTTSGTDGSFLLNNIPPGLRTFTIVKGQFSKTFQITIIAGQTVNAPAASTTLPTTGPGAAKIAVVTGSFDRIQDVLAKLGYGSIDSLGRLQLGTQKFDLYDGDGSLPSTYPEIGALLNNPTRLASYKTVFINCGAEELVTGAPISNLRNYVNGGGRLFATDLAYDYVEQAFPAGIDFLGSNGTPTNQAENPDEAERGQEGITVEATIPNTGLREFLNNRSALNANGTAHIEGFLSGWGVINSVPATTQIFTQGNVTYDVFDQPFSQAGKKTKATHSHGIGTRSGNKPRVTAIKPLTVVFSAGSGRVLYSSYHTDETPSPNLRPQEQILAYLVFQL